MKRENRETECRLMDIKAVEINILIYPEGDTWIAQGLEYDVTAQALTLKELRDKFMMKIVAEFVIALDLEREPFYGVAAAPDRFWREFEEAESVVQKELPPFKIEGDNTFLPKFSMPSMRIAQKPVVAAAI